jgi:hypothetical protein
MNSPQLGLRVASVFSGLLCVAHLVRLLAEIQIQVGGYRVGLWPSALAAVLGAAFCYWFWRLARPPVAPPPAA